MKQMYSLADGPLGARIGEQAETKGFKVLAYYSTGDQHFQTRKAPVRSLADFKGLKMRVIQNKAVIDGFRALGAVPTPLPYPEIYTALQQGTVDGTGNDLLTVTLAKFYEVTKFFTWSSYLVEPRPAIMSKSYFDGLPADFRQLLLKPLSSPPSTSARCSKTGTAAPSSRRRRPAWTLYRPHRPREVGRPDVARSGRISARRRRVRPS